MRRPASRSLQVTARRLCAWLLAAAPMLFTAPPLLAADPLVVGVFPRRPATVTRSMFQPLADHLAAALQRPVELVVPPDFPSFWAAVQAGRFDLMHSNQYQYVRAHKELGYRAVAINEEHGSATIRATIWVRRDSGIETPDDLRGQKVLFGGGRMAMVSYVMSAELLRQAGLHERDYVSQFALNPTQALTALYYRQCAAAGLNRHADRQTYLSEQFDFSELRPLLVSEPIPLLPWSVKADVAPELEQRMRQTLVTLHDDPDGPEVLAGAALTGLLPAGDSDFDGVRALLLRTTGEDFRED